MAIDPRESAKALLLPIVLASVVRALRAMRPPLIIEETDLHTLVADALRAAGVVFEREVVLGPRERIDFLAGGAIGIECKKGKPNGPRLTRQVRRYCGHARVQALVVVAPWKRHLPKPAEVNGRRVVYLSLNELWGVAT